MNDDGKEDIIEDNHDEEFGDSPCHLGGHSNDDNDDDGDDDDGYDEEEDDALEDTYEC